MRPLQIILCKEADREEMARRFYRLKSFEVIEETYQRQVKGLEAMQPATPITMGKLQQERDQAKANAEKAAEGFSQGGARPAFTIVPASPRLFLDGRIDDAIKLLDEDELRRTAQEGERQIADAVQAWLLKGCLSTLTFHFEAAQGAYKEALRYLKREADPQLWAATQVEVGGTHAELGIRGEGEAANEHLTNAITAYRNALEVYTRERLPQDWAAVQTNLGNALQAQGLRTGGSQGATTSEWRRIWRKQRTCLNRRRPLSERDFPSLAYISSSRTRVLKHHPGASAGHAPEARPSHSLKSRTCRNTSCSPSS